jgi:3-oxoacyl-[acyl-carrier-protein] synthase II
VNLATPDDACDLNYIQHAGRDARAQYVLSNSFGFGGINAALAFGAVNGAPRAG